LRAQVKRFVDERDWSQYHSPKNLSMSLAVEAAELMEIFLWMENDASHDEVFRKRQAVEEELADVIFSAFCLANSCDIDVADAFERKIASTSAKYPVDKVRGKYHKYTEYKDS